MNTSPSVSKPAGPRLDDRALLVWTLESGSREEVDHPVRRREASVRGELARGRSYQVRDLVEPRDGYDAGIEAATAAALPVWSKAYAAFVLHGFEVQEADAELALASLRPWTDRNPLIEAIILTHDRLAAELDPLHAASPGDILYLAAAWPMDLRPREPYFAGRAVAELVKQNQILTDELDKARRKFSEGFDTSVTHHKKRAVKAALAARAEIYLSMLANHHYSHLIGNTTAIANELRTLLTTVFPKAPKAPAVISPKHERKSVIVLSVDSIAEMLERGWEAAEIAGTDGKKGPKKGSKKGSKKGEIS